MWKSTSNEKKKKWMIMLSGILGPLWARHFNAITKNLEALNWNLKPGFLWDHGPKISVEKLMELIQTLKNAEMLSQDIYVICVDADFILVNVPKFLSTYKVLADSSFPSLDTPGGSEQITQVIAKFIDVSNNIDGPRFVTPGSNNYETILNMLKTLLATLREYLNKPESLKSHLIIKVEHGWCVPTVFGLLVGYPVVYWYNGDPDSCSVTLEIYKLVAENNFALYSFSIPTVLLPNVRVYLQKWCKDTIDNAEKVGIYFKNMKLTVKRVTMNTIIL